MPDFELVIPRSPGHLPSNRAPLSTPFIPTAERSCTQDIALFSSVPYFVLTCTWVGIHPGWVEQAPPIELTTSRTEALQARRSCASSLDFFTQSFLHRAWPKSRGPEIGSRSALIVVAHVFSWPPARLCPAQHLPTTVIWWTLPFLRVPMTGPRETLGWFVLNKSEQAEQVLPLKNGLFLMSPLLFLFL